MSLTPKTAVAQLLRSVNAETQITSAEPQADISALLLRLRVFFETANPGIATTGTLLKDTATFLRKSGLTNSSNIASQLASKLQRQSDQYTACSKSVLRRLSLIPNRALPNETKNRLRQASAVLDAALKEATQDSDAIYLALRKAYRILIDSNLEEGITILLSSQPAKRRAKTLRNWATNLGIDVENSTRKTLVSSAIRLQGSIAVIEEPHRFSVRQSFRRFLGPRDTEQAFNQTKTLFESLDPFLKVRKMVDAVDVITGLTRESRHQNIAQRTFESFLSANLVKSTPRATRLGWDAFAAVVGQELLELDMSDRLLIAFETCRLVRQDKPRVWWNKTLKLYAFANNIRDGEGNLSALMEALLEPCLTGWHVAAKALLIINLSRAMAERNKGKKGKAMRDEGNKFYKNEIMPRRGRDIYSETQAGYADSSVGITLKDQKSIVFSEDNPEVATRSVLKYPIRMNHKKIISFLDQQHVVATGLSGSTNILIYNYSWAIKEWP